MKFENLIPGNCGECWSDSEETRNANISVYEDGSKVYSNVDEIEFTTYESTGETKIVTESSGGKFKAWRVKWQDWKKPNEMSIEEFWQIYKSI